jgi:hypothetical protein
MSVPADPELFKRGLRPGATLKQFIAMYMLSDPSVSIARQSREFAAFRRTWLTGEMDLSARGDKTDTPIPSHSQTLEGLSQPAIG